MAYNGIAAVVYLSAFLANAASVRPYIGTYYYGTMAAAAVRRLTAAHADSNMQPHTQIQCHPSVYISIQSPLGLSSSGRNFTPPVSGECTRQWARQREKGGG